MKELPGMLMLAKNIKKGKWPHTMDATVWATEFFKHAIKNPEIATDFDTMRAWFANAIMAGWDTAMMRKKK